MRKLASTLQQLLLPLAHLDGVYPMINSDLLERKVNDGTRPENPDHLTPLRKGLQSEGKPTPLCERRMLDPKTQNRAQPQMESDPSELGGNARRGNTLAALPAPAPQAASALPAREDASDGKGPGGGDWVGVRGVNGNGG